MRNILLVLLGALIFAGSQPSVSWAASESIAAIVNEDAITQSDVDDRVNLIMISSRMPNRDDIRSKLQPQVLNALIEEQIKLQEARRLEQSVTQEEIDDGFAQIAQQNNASAEQFKEMIMRSGINIHTMYRQIEAQIAWTKAVQVYIRPQITVSDADVADALARLKENIGKTEYQVAEIYLPIEGAEGVSDVRALANQLSQDMQAGRVPFFKVAQQFSKSAGASKGGDLGWVGQGQLDPELEEALARMEKNTVSPPIKSRSGYHILMLRDTRTISEDTMPSSEGMTQTIGTERLERMQRRHLQDLKAGAFIEHRV